MNNITVRSSLMAALGLFSAMLLLGALLGVFSLNTSNRSSINIGRISAQAVAINDVYKETLRARTAFLRAFVALTQSHDEKTKTSALERVTEYVSSVQTRLSAFEKMPAFDGQDAASRAALVDQARTMSVALSKGVDELNRDDVAAFMAVNGKDITDSGQAMTKQIEAFQNLASKLTADAAAAREADYTHVLWMVGLGLSGAFALVMLVYVLLNRVVIAPLNRAVFLLERVALGDLTMPIDARGRNEIGLLFSAMQRMQQGLLKTVSQVRNSSDTINNGALEIAAGNMNLSSRTETQASSLEETAASMEELTGTVRQNSANALQANQLVHAASVIALMGGEVMGQMVGTMTAINDSSRKIVDIISVIDSIAFQTNILALNAAVEAARAGEQGRGFAIVAAEVRNLAQRSAAAAKEIKSLISDSVDKVDSGSRLVKQAGTAMNEVVASVQRVSDIVSEIAEASREQSDGIEQVNQAIIHMDMVTQQNAALVEQAAAATQSLQSQAAELVDAVGAFKIDEAATSNQMAGAPLPPVSHRARNARNTASSYRSG